MTSRYLNQWLSSLLTHICVTRPQWVNQHCSLIPYACIVKPQWDTVCGYNCLYYRIWKNTWVNIIILKDINPCRNLVGCSLSFILWLDLNNFWKFYIILVNILDALKFQGCLLNTLKLRRNGRHFAHDIFKCFSLNENVWILIKFHWNLFLRVQLTIFQHLFR